MDMLEKLKELLKTNPTQYGKILKSKNYLELYDWINSQTSPYLDDEIYTLKTKIYWILNGIKSFDDPKCKCKSCGKTMTGLNVYDLKVGYRACSQKCSIKDKKRTEKIQRTVMEKYGVSNYFLSEEGKKKQKDWLKEKGADNTFQLEYIKEKIKQTKKERYGIGK